MTAHRNTIRRSLFSLLLAAVTLFAMCGAPARQLVNQDKWVNIDGPDPEYADSDSETVGSYFLDNLRDKEAIFAEASRREAETQASGDNSLAASGSSNPLQALRRIVDDEFSGAAPAPVTVADAGEVEVNSVSPIVPEPDKPAADRPAMVVPAKKKKAMISKPKALITASEADVFPPDVDIARLYDEALDDYYSQRYARAIVKFRKVLLADEQQDLADQCQFWIAQAYFAIGRYYDAIVAFEKVSIYAESEKIAEAQLMIGIALYRSGERHLARNEFVSIISHFYNRTVTRTARKYLQLIANA